jgi:hypothetical protein
MKALVSAMHMHGNENDPWHVAWTRHSLVARCHRPRIIEDLQFTLTSLAIRINGGPMDAPPTDL